jgi:hypothetical protein
MVSDAGHLPYRAFLSLAEAKGADDGVAVFEGDWGGQIYLVVRAFYIRCSESVLRQLLEDLDALRWCEPEGARVYYEQHPVGAGISGGMGGGAVNPEVWVHEELREHDPVIRRVLRGEQAGLNG